MGREERGGENKIQGKKIQTLFLEIVRNPPQLHHMTFQKENATLLPPTQASPHFIQLSINQPPSVKYHNTTLHITPTDTIYRLLCIYLFKGLEQKSTHSDCDITNSNLPVNYLFVTVKTWHHQYQFRAEFKVYKGKQQHASAVHETYQLYPGTQLIISLKQS